MRKSTNSTPWKIGAVVIFALAAFSYWFFLCPHVMAAREQAQLFLWNGDYLLSRLAVPGGLAQYLGECIVQFFVNPAVGACLYALLFVLAQVLALRLLRQAFPEKKGTLLFLLSFVPAIALWALALSPYVPMTFTVAVLLTMGLMAFLPTRRTPRSILLLFLIPLSYWLLGPAAVLLLLCFPQWKMAVAGIVLFVVCVVASSWLAPYPLRQLARGIDYYWDDDYMSTKEEMEYDALARKGNWQKIIEKVRNIPPKSEACQHVATIAGWHMGLVAPQDLQQCLRPSGGVMQSQSDAFMMSEVYLLLGMANMSQRAAFEAMESTPNHNKSGRALMRLSETALITGQYDLARKYLSILDETLFYKNHAKSLRALVDNPETISRHPSYKKLCEMYAKTKDMFFY